MRSSVAIVGIAAASLIAGCGSLTTAGSGQTSGGGSSAAGAGAGSGGGSSTPAGGATNAGGAGGAAVDVCMLLPAADLSKITGTTFTDTKPSVIGPIFKCDYTSASLTQLDVDVTTVGGKVGYDADVQVLTTIGHPPTPVSGVGDKAFSEHSGNVGVDASASFGALYGDMYINISGLNAVTADQGTQIVQELHGKL